MEAPIHFPWHGGRAGLQPVEKQGMKKVERERERTGHEEQPLQPGLAPRCSLHPLRLVRGAASRAGQLAAAVTAHPSSRKSPPEINSAPSKGQRAGAGCSGLLRRRRGAKARSEVSLARLAGWTQHLPNQHPNSQGLDPAPSLFPVLWKLRRGTRRGAEPSGGNSTERRLGKC